MEYKKLFRRVWALLVSPSKAWDEITTENVSGRQVLAEFAYPLIGFCGLAEFAGVMLKGGDTATLLFQEAMMRCCSVAVSLFGGLFLATYLLDVINRKWIKSGVTYDRLLAFVAYSMVVIFVLDFIRGLSIEQVIVRILLQLYTAVIAYEGIRRWLQMREEQQSRMAVIATILLLVCPTAIEFIFNKLSVILN